MQSISDEKRAAVHDRLDSFDRAKLLDTFGDRFAAAARAPASRKAAYLIAERLVRHGIPPCFWRHYLSKPADELPATQQFDLMVYVLLWQRRHYLDHARVIC
jgi:hypothetical protein